MVTKEQAQMQGTQASVLLPEVIEQGGGGGYVLPTASVEEKGGIKVGEGLAMDGEFMHVKTEGTAVGLDVNGNLTINPDGVTYEMCNEDLRQRIDSGGGGGGGTVPIETVEVEGVTCLAPHLEQTFETEVLSGNASKLLYEGVLMTITAVVLAPLPDRPQQVIAGGSYPSEGSFMIRIIRLEEPIAAHNFEVQSVMF